jgi:hypothetical protein
MLVLSSGNSFANAYTFFTSYPEPKIKPNTHYEKKMSIIHNSGRAKRASDIVASLSGIRKLAYTSPARPRENNILSSFFFAILTSY